MQPGVRRVLINVVLRQAEIAVRQKRVRDAAGVEASAVEDALGLCWKLPHEIVGDPVHQQLSFKQTTLVEINLKLNQCSQTGTQLNNVSSWSISVLWGSQSDGGHC